ncbi:diaminobutyrate--2-oxoglutarate transaminase [Yunchengibacter salinarum]|uniref:diaminobutyrate--2-oxoglutarate transaminase n=1 Tax=Yunchengibacter salinarum TaxID=3133399 RepID=UPI0035B618BF
MTDNKADIFEQYESAVRSYCRSVPVVFNKAEGAYMYSEDGEKYLDFLAGAGALNYGHNDPDMVEALVAYIREGGIVHGLDFHSRAKAEFIETLQDKILRPRDMDYLIQFTGPTGTNCVEASMKLARKVTGRTNIIAFTNGFHGVTMGALAASANQHHRCGAGAQLCGVQRMPYDGYMGEGVDTLTYFEQCLNDPSSGIDKPAAVLFEGIQGEGGLNVASFQWMKRLEEICRAHDILLIADDIQAGCGRSGTFFSFEPSGIKPDMINMSKSLSGLGLPAAIVLVRKDLDIWKPGEHNGTFRGNAHAFVTAKAAMDKFWSDDRFEKSVREKADVVAEALDAIAARHKALGVRRKGRGMMQGLAFDDPAVADAITGVAFEHNMIIETAGPRDEVVKCLIPLTIEMEDLKRGLDILARSVDRVAADHPAAAAE